MALLWRSGIDLRIERGELIAVAVLVIIGVVLIRLAPGKQSVKQVSAAGA